MIGWTAGFKTEVCALKKSATGPTFFFFISFEHSVPDGNGHFWTYAPAIIITPANTFEEGASGTFTALNQGHTFCYTK